MPGPSDGGRIVKERKEFPDQSKCCGEQKESCAEYRRRYWAAQRGNSIKDANGPASFNYFFPGQLGTRFR
jgi:hypothetical protein